MGFPTQWSNSDNKPPSRWSNVGKTPTIFTGNNAKVPSTWTPGSKNPTSFAPNKAGQIPYPYADPNIKYVDMLRGYTYQATVKSGTAWSPVA